MDDRERDLADATAELSDTLETLRTELREPARGPLGLPRPPRPSELIQFTEQYTIPTIIAILETSIKVLELLAAGLRVADGRPLDAAGGSSDRRPGAETLDAVGRAGRDQLARTSRETLRRLDEALAELQSAAAGDPSNPELRELLDEARKLRAEVDERLSDAVAETGPTSDEQRDAGHSTDADISSVPDEDGVGIDVDEELASIKDDLDTERPSDVENDGENGGTSK